MTISSHTAIVQLMKTERIEMILNRILGQDARDSDVALLFLWIRDLCEISNQEDRLLWDLACYVSHNQERNQGESHKRIKKVLIDLIAASKKGGSFGFGKPVFLRDALIETLIVKLREDVHLNFDEAALRAKKNFIADSLQMMVEGTEFIGLEALGPGFVSCCLVRHNGSVSYDVRLNLPGSLFDVNPSLQILFPLFDQ